MPRTARPWWRAQRNMWCVTVAGHRIQLGPHPEGAAPPKYNKRKDLWNVPEAIEDAWKTMQRGEPPVVSPDTSWAILDAFLEWTEKNRSPERTAGTSTTSSGSRTGCRTRPSRSSKPTIFRPGSTGKKPGA